MYNGQNLFLDWQRPAKYRLASSESWNQSVKPVLEQTIFYKKSLKIKLVRWAVNKFLKKHSKLKGMIQLKW